MGIFDPKIDANIAPPQAVSQGPSGASVFANVLGGAIQAYGAGMKVAASSGPTAGERKDAMQNAQLVGLSDSLLKVEALRRDGRVAEADRAEQAVLANAARDGVDLSDGQTKALFRATTGRDPAYMGVSQEQRVTEELMKSPDFQNNYIASYASGKDMSPEERTNFALAQIARTQGHKLVMANESIAWHEGRQEAFTGAITSFQGTTLGALQIAAAEGKMVPLGMIDQAQVQWDAQKSALIAARPTGLPEADWKSVQAQMDATDQSFAVLRKVSGAEAIDAQLAQAFTASVMAMDAPNSEKMMLLTLIKDPQQLKEFGVITNKRVKELLEATTVSGFDMGEFGTLSDPTVNSGKAADGSPKLFPDSIMKDIEGLDAGELLGQTKGIIKAHKMSNNDAVLSDPSVRDAFTKTTSKAFAAMTAISKDNKEFVSGKTINEVFDGSIIAGIDTVARTNPAIARTLFRQGEEALNQQDAIATQAMGNLISQNPNFGFENGRVVMDAGAMINLGFDFGVQEKFVEAAGQYYGGDLAAMFADRGRLIDPRNSDLKQQRDLLRGGGAIDGISKVVDQMNAQGQTIRTIRDKRNTFRTRADTLAPQPEKASEDAVNFAAEMLRPDSQAANIRGFDKVVTDEPFLNAVNKASGNLGINPDHLLGVISFETVGTFSPAAKNPEGSATGLIQFLEKTAKNLGTTTAELRNMTREEQMVYVEKYLAPFKGRMKNLGDVYMAVHWPDGVGKGDDYVMYKRGSKEYEVNKNLDLNNDGVVTRGDTLQRVRSVFGKGSRGPTNGALGAGATPEVTVTELPAGPTGISTDDLVSGAGAAIEAAQVSVDPSEELTAPTKAADEATPSKEASGPKTGSQKLDAQTLEALKKLNIDDELRFYSSMEEAQKAINEGKLSVGDLYMVNGEIKVVKTP